MRLRIILSACVLSTRSLLAQAPAPFTLEQITSYPFPSELTAAPAGGRIAWALNEQGRRNIWVADVPNYQPRRLTSYTVDDGQELTSVTLTPNRQKNWPSSTPTGPPPRMTMLAGNALSVVASRLVQ